MGPLTKRILTAAVAIPVLLLLTFWNKTFPWRLLVSLALSLSLWEFLMLAGLKEIKVLKVEGMTALGIFLLPWILKPWLTWSEGDSFLMALLLITLSFLWSSRSLKDMVFAVSITFFGVAYFGIFSDYVFRLREMTHGAWHLLWLYAATWAYDTGGYFIGKRFGKHSLAPVTSPKKTWEGCVGGFLFVVTFLFLFWRIFPVYNLYSGTEVALLSLLLSVFAQLGDLTESLIKRSLGAKDSGTLIPGHGGIFDRIDSLLFNAPVLFYFLILFKHELPIRV